VTGVYIAGAVLVGYVWGYWKGAKARQRLPFWRRG
jgi:hypothetical protein